MDQVDALRGASTIAEPNSTYLAKPQMKRSDWESEVYSLDYPNLGTAVIISNEKFERGTGLNRRIGTNVDADTMYELLNTIGFEKIIQLKDLTVTQMKNELQRVAKLDYSKTSCFVCILLSHGEEGYIFGTDGKVSIEDLVLPLKGNNCPGLVGKPKIFFVQACKGDMLDEGEEVADAGEMDVEEEAETLGRIPTEADFLTVYSTIPGSLAWKTSVRGSWFIQAVSDVFNEHWTTMDILTMMTHVNRKVARDTESVGRKQIPCITSMLTKDFFFRTN
ncbi:unnamed protein product [Lymnaea stagnalis]|uniref:Caspase-3 n=1 Tax=Lymnaea stagnalis TaxID=6523 RepID=A0AAV2H7L8_LYMST